MVRAASIRRRRKAKMTTGSDMAAQEIARAFTANLHARKSFAEPYPHHLLDDTLPPPVIASLAHLPFDAPDLHGVSGKRELHNDTRSYFDTEAMARFPVMKAVAEAFQATEVVTAIAATFDAPVDDTFLRLEYAQDIDGFWLEPHTDLGVKKFTCLIYLSEGHEDLGTDIYRAPGEHAGRSPFKPGVSMIFVPSDRSWHGFERRPIHGVRKSVILNYVTHDWRAREQLSFPHEPVRVIA
jgi:hypothetical protein